MNLKKRLSLLLVSFVLLIGLFVPSTHSVKAALSTQSGDTQQTMNWVLTKDLHVDKLDLPGNMKLDLNGYNLKVDGDLNLLSGSELRAESGTIQAGNLNQESDSTIQLNNSQLEVDHTFTQGGLLRVNGKYGNDAATELLINGSFVQKDSGDLELNGYSLTVNGNLDQAGTFNMSGGSVHVKGDTTQKGWFNLDHGELTIAGNLYLNGGPLLDEEFTKNKSMNVNGGHLQVGSPESMALSRTTGNVIQESGQFYINYGIVNIYGDYTIQDGWLTMIHGTMDTTSDSLMEVDGDYVHVYRDFTMQSPRNHAERIYNYLGKPENDQAQLTDGILRVDGNFKQIGDREYHQAYSDRSQNYLQDYSRYNFVASGRHKVLLTGKGTIDVEGSGFHFNILQLEGSLADYTLKGSVKWNQLIETDASSNANLASLSINDIPVHDFSPDVLNYSHTVPASGITGPLQTLKVDARAEDSRNAKVEVIGNSLGVDGTAQVKILVTAHDGTTKKLYTVNVTLGDVIPGKVTSIALDQTELTFIKNASSFNPVKETIGYTVLPTNASNQKVTWTSSDPSVASVSQTGVVTPLAVGETTITAKTEEGGFVDSVNVKVLLPYDLLEGIKTLADFVNDSDRYNQIMALYDPSHIGIVVPGQFIDSVTFTQTANPPAGNIVNGKIKIVDPSVSRVEVLVNGQQLPATSIAGSNQYLFSRLGLKQGDYIEIIAYNSAGDELERIGTSYPVNYERNLDLPFGFYSIEYLMTHTEIFNQILGQYSLDQLRFAAR